MALNLSAASEILKVRYIGTIREQLNNATVLLQKIGRQDQMVSGKDFTVPLHTGRNTSAGTGLDDGGTLPTAGQQSYQTTIVPNKYLYGSIQVTGPTIAATRDNAGAFVEALNSEVDGLMRDFKRDMNRQLNGNGTGWLAYLSASIDTAVGSSVSSRVDDNLGNPFVHLPTSAFTVDVLDATTATTQGTFSVTLGAADSTSYAITSSSVTVAISGSGDGDMLIRSGAMGKEMMGIQGIIDDGNPHASVNATGLQGLAVASHPYWKAQVVGSDSTPASLAFEDLQQVIDQIATSSDYSESDISFMFSNYGARRAYYKLCIAERRHVNTMELDGGWKAVEFNGIPWVVDSQARRECIFFINPDTMKIFRTSDFDWMDKDGSYIARVDGKDAYQAVLFHYGNLACLSRNGNGILKGVIEA